MAGDMFGPCPDLFMIFDDTLVDDNGNRIVRFFSATNRSDTVDVCLDPVKGATIDGDEVTIINGILQLPDTYFLTDCTGEELESGSAVITKIVSPDGTEWVCNEDGSTVAPCTCPSINLIKTTIPGPYEEGDEVVYQFIVHNDGPIDLIDVIVTDPDVTVIGDPISLAAGASNANNFTGVYTYTAEDVEAGGRVNIATVSGMTEYGEEVTSMDAVGIFNLDPEPELIKRCGVLPEQTAIVSMASTSNPVTASDGDVHNLNSVAEHKTAGGTLLASVTQEVNLISGGLFIEKDSAMPGTVDAHTFFDRDGFVRSGLSFGSDSVTSGDVIINEFFMSFAVTDEIGDGLTIEGCEGSARSEIHAIDVDNGSIMSNLSRPWDDMYQGPDPQTPLPPTEDPAGTFTFGPQQNAFLDFDADLADEDVASFNYAQHADDSLLVWSQIYYTLAVCVMEDVDGNIVSAETIDGPLAESEWANIEFTGEV